MKHLVFILFAGIFIGLGIFAGSCNLKMIPDVECRDFVANFKVDKSNFPCYPDTCMVTFTSLVTGGIVIEYDWTLGNGTNTKEAFTHTYSDPGDYAVRLSVTSDDGCKNDTTIVVTIDNPQDEKPIAEFAPADTMGTAHFTVRFRNLSFSPTAATYLWNFGDSGSPSNTSNVPEPTHIYEKAGTYTVTLMTTNDKGADTVAGTVVVKPRTFAKTFDIDSKSTPNETAMLVDEDDMGNFLVATNSYSFTGGVFGDTWLSKFPYDAAQVSSKTLVAPLSNLIFHKIHTGKKISTGYALAGFSEFSPGTSNDFFFLRTDQNLATPAQNTYTDAISGKETCYGFCEISQNEFLLCGNKDEAGSASDGMLLIKANVSSGSLTRKKIFSGSLSYTAFDVVKTGTGFVVLGVHLNSATGFNEACLIQLDNALDLIGSPKYLGSYSPDRLIRLDDSNFIVLASNPSGGGTVLKTDLSGATPITIQTFSNTWLKAGIITTDSDLVLVGHTRSSPPSPMAAQLSIANMSVNPVWQRSSEEYGGNRELHCLSQTSDKGYIIGGVESGKTLLVRTNAEGKVND